MYIEYSNVLRGISVWYRQVSHGYSFYTFCLDIDWSQVGMGIALSMGQVWAVQNLVASSLINFAVFLHSPLLFVMATIGATIGTLIGAAFLPPDSLWEGKVSHSNSGCKNIEFFST